MINLTLLKKEIKSTYKIQIIFMFILTLYAGMIISMFDPKLGESLEQMANSMPSLFSAFSMSSPGSTLIEFIGNYLYGFLLIVFPIIFILILSNKLITRYIDRGSLAYLLSTPNKRGKIIRTQAFVMILNILILVLYVTGICILFSKIMFDSPLNITRFLIINLGLFSLHLFLSGLTFLICNIFKDGKNSLSISSGILILFVLIKMVSEVGDKFEKIKYATPLTLFSPTNIINQEGHCIICIASLFAIGVIFYILGCIIFTKKDFSL